MMSKKALDRQSEVRVCYPSFFQKSLHLGTGGFKKVGLDVGSWKLRVLAYLMCKAWIQFLLPQTK